MNIQDLLITDKEDVAFSEIMLTPAIQSSLDQFIQEHRFIEELKAYGLPVSNKILFSGDSGCGKTMTAKALAKSLNKPIYILNLSNIVCSRIGETSQNIKQIFEKASREKAVLFLDEFDQIGKERGNDDKDVGEMRRLVNTLIQLIDYFPDQAVLIAATNHLSIIDQALIRRFQLRISFHLPEMPALDEYYDKMLQRFPESMRNIERKYNISYAEAKDLIELQIKKVILDRLEKENR